MEEINQYKNLVDRLANNKDRQIFTNKGASHASIVLSNIFDQTRYVLNIYTGKLDKNVNCVDTYYLEHLTQCLKRGVSTKIIFDDLQEKKDLPESIKSLIEKSSDKIDLKLFKLKPSYSREQNKDKKYHFTTGDHQMFRFENDTVDYKAICSFNDPISVDKLDKHFSELLNVSEEI